LICPDPIPNLNISNTTSKYNRITAVHYSRFDSNLIEVITIAGLTVYRITAVMKVKTDIITSIVESLIVLVVILVVMYF
jgi:hypothetical protein